jgi:hypothetical protein
MANEIIFEERQRFHQWWLWTLLASVNLIFFYGIYRQIYCGESFGTNPASNTWLIIITVCCLALSAFVLNFRLDTQIKSEGIYFRMFPIHFAFRFYSWDRIEKSWVRKYNPIGEYGGWGYRFGFLGSGKAYNISGNMGIQLVLKDGKHVLLGTRKPEEARAALRKLDRLVE